MKINNLTVGVVVALAVVAPSAPAQDVVIRMNNLWLDVVRANSLGPPPVTRAMGMLNVPMFEAINLIDAEPAYESYYPKSVYGDVSPTANKTAAAARAAHRVLSGAYPPGAAAYDAELAAILGEIPDGPDKTAGVDFGNTVGQYMLDQRAGDGWNAMVEHPPAAAPGDWKPTPPAFGPPAVPQWGNITLFSSVGGVGVPPVDVTDYVAPGPPALDSMEYADAFNEIKDIGRFDSATRTEDQSNIARFWANPGGTSTPAGQWNRITQIAAENEGLTLEENARVFALFGITMADVAVTSFYNKYLYNHWRPVTAIQEADTDGNPLTEPDPDWLPFIGTPPFPTYTAAHGTASGAISELLALEFGDETDFILSAEGFDVPDRTFTSFRAAGDEGAISRLYGGIHWSYDNDDALTFGRQLGAFVQANYFKPVPEPSALALVGCGLLGSFAWRRKRKSTAVAEGGMS